MRALDAHLITQRGGEEGVDIAREPRVRGLGNLTQRIVDRGLKPLVHLATNDAQFRIERVESPRGAIALEADALLDFFANRGIKTLEQRLDRSLPACHILSLYPEELQREI